MSLVSFLPGLPRPDIAQMLIFLAIFTCSVLGLSGNWPGVSYLLNNGTLLFICIFTIGLPNAKSHYLFSYALMLSPVIDAFSIGCNWLQFEGVIEDFIFYWSLTFALLLIVLKLAFSLYHLELAKNLNNELSPVTDVYKLHAFQELINRAKPTPAAAKNTDASKLTRDIEAVPVKSAPSKPPHSAAATPIQTHVHETSKASATAAPVEAAPIQAPAVSSSVLLASESVPEPTQ